MSKSELKRLCVQNPLEMAEEITALRAELQRTLAKFSGELVLEREHQSALRQRAQENEGMAECMDMTRRALIDAGVIDESVPPMFVAEAVLSYIAKLQTDAERYRWLRRRDVDTIDLGGMFVGKTPDNIVLTDMDLDRELDAVMKTFSIRRQS